MNYPGNATLSPAVRDRVVSTFQQSVLLFKSGRMDEVSAGCNLILQMDPSFEPARRLLEKAKNPSLPIDVDSLLPQDGGSGMEQARQAMAERDFQSVIHLTTEILTNDLLNDEARILGDQARERMEAAPFVDQFARKCSEHLAAGRISAAKADLEKARALDATHPEIVRISRELTAREAAPAPAASPSFVIDDAAISGGRSAAQASDFGFTFEEEKPPAEAGFADFSFGAPAPAAGASGFGGFSFDSPSPSAAPAAGGNEFDFSSASVSTSEDDQKKISRYLEEGDQALESGDLQHAIDIWSRIFLIDVTNDQASDRIERAKGRRKELDRRIEPLLTEGIGHFDRGRTAEAHEAFSEILRLDPGNAMAQDYLDRLGETVEGGASARTAPFTPPPAEAPLDLDFDRESDLGGIEPPLAPPSPPKASKEARKGTAPKPASRKLPLGAIAALVGVLVIGAGGWFAWSRFMNKPEADPAAASAIFTRASSLASSGKYDQAIALLQDIQPGDPQHDKALGMIADLQQKKSTNAQLIDGVPAAQYFDQRLAAARTAFESHDYSSAKLAFEQAMRVRPLPPDLKAQYDATSQQVAKLDSAKALFSERKYSEAIANLQPLLDQDPQSLDVRRLIVDAHFNLGAVALQEERTKDAIKEFDAVLAITPDDELAQRSRALALRYDDEKRDLLYRIFVKYLPLRQAS